MKYKHYSPKAKVVLNENTSQESLTGLPLEARNAILQQEGQSSSSNTTSIPTIGIVSTRHWVYWARFNSGPESVETNDNTSHGIILKNKATLEGTSFQLKFGQSFTRKMQWPT